jgi:hypothetical protein
VAYLSLLGVADDKLAILPLHYRLTRTWRSIEPFVLSERRLRNDPLAFFNVLEAFVERVQAVDISEEVQAVRKRFAVK